MPSLGKVIPDNLQTDSGVGGFVVSTRPTENDNKPKKKSKGGERKKGDDEPTRVHMSAHHLDQPTYGRVLVSFTLCN